MNNYGESLKEMRESKGYSQNALSKAIGISQPKISYYEKEQHAPPIDFCIQLAKFYNCTLDDLVGFKSEINSSNEKALSEQPKKSLSTFDNEFGEILDDKNFVQTAKLFKAAKPELRALAFGYLVGLFQSNGLNTKLILGF